LVPNNFNDDEHNGTVKEFYNISDVVWKKIDQSELIDRRNTITGEPLEKIDGLVAQKKATDDPVVKEFSRVGASPQPFSRKVTRSKGLVKVDESLTKEEYDRLWDIYEQFPVRETLEKTISDPRYQKIADPTIQKRVLLSVVEKYRGAATKAFLKGETRVTDSMKLKALKQSRAIAGYQLEPDPVRSLWLFKTANDESDEKDDVPGVTPELKEWLQK
jgi:hypothetical protein